MGWTHLGLELPIGFRGTLEGMLARSPRLPTRNDFGQMGSGGFTLVELMVALAITGFIMLGIASFMAQTSKNLIQDSRIKARDLIVEEVRRLAADPNALRTSAGMPADPDGTYTDAEQEPKATLPTWLQSTNIAAQAPGNLELQRCLAGTPATYVPGTVCNANEWISFELYEPVYIDTSVADEYIRVGGMDRNSPAAARRPQLYRQDGTRCPDLLTPTPDCRFQIVTQFRAVCRENSLTPGAPREFCDTFEDEDPSSPTNNALVYAVESIQVRLIVQEISAAGGVYQFSDIPGGGAVGASLSDVDRANRMFLTGGRVDTVVLPGCGLRGEACGGVNW